MKKHRSHIYCLRLLCSIVGLLVPGLLFAQELNCNVTIDASKINTQQVAEKQVFVEMKNAIMQFMIVLLDD